MINLNMEGTIRSSLLSILDQLDERFEVIVCDGGSNDKSLVILKELQREYANLRLIELSRDFSRKKGMDRNVSVKNANGKYVLLHLDCDDVYKNHIIDWVQCFHAIEKKIQRDCLISGKHINMLSVELFNEVGGYKNIEFEDRDLWMRLASENRLIIFDHEDFVIRQPRTLTQKIYKNTIEVYYAVYSDLIQGMEIRTLTKHYVKILNKSFSKVQLVKLLILPWAYINSLKSKNFKKNHHFDPISFSLYTKANKKNLNEILQIEDSDIPIKFKNNNSYKIFKKCTIS
jgi:glycosyltransferase involved in cell wall biosynthesis